MGSLWQWINLDWNVVPKKLDRLRDRGGKIYVCKKLELCSSILRGSNRRFKKSLKNTCFYDMKIGPFWPIFGLSGHPVPRVPGTSRSKFMLIITLCNGKMPSHVKIFRIDILYYSVSNPCKYYSSGYKAVKSSFYKERRQICNGDCPSRASQLNCFFCLVADKIYILTR